MGMPDPTVQQIASVIRGWLNESVGLGTDQAAKIVFGNSMVSGALEDWSQGIKSNEDCLAELQAVLNDLVN